LKEFNGKILLLTSLLVLCIVLPFDYYRKNQRDRLLSEKLTVLKTGILNEENRIATAEDLILETLSPSPHAEEEEIDVSGLVLGGTCFFELHEIDAFLMEKLQESDEQPKLYPPLGLTCLRVDQGVELTWSPNPQNEALIQNLADNPLLMLGYKIYRWTSDINSKPTAVQKLSYQRSRYIDTEIRPVASRYFYSVLCVFEGIVAEQKTLIESERSEFVSIDCGDRFDLKIISGTLDQVDVEVSLFVDGIPRSRVFTVREGDEIGGKVELPGSGQVDFFTTLKVIAIGMREEDREETLQHPVFESDGSRSLDPISKEPIFQSERTMVTHQLILIECEDPYGNQRIVEES